MARLVRKQIYIDAAQERALKALSERLGLSEAELIRRALDDGLVRGGLGMNRLRPFDADIWAQEKRAIAQLKVPGRAARRRTWTREDLYKERLSRYGRR